MYVSTIGLHLPYQTAVVVLIVKVVKVVIVIAVVIKIRIRIKITIRIMIKIMKTGSIKPSLSVRVPPPYQTSPPTL